MLDPPQHQHEDDRCPQGEGESEPWQALVDDGTAAARGLQRNDDDEGYKRSPGSTAPCSRRSPHAIGARWPRRRAACRSSSGSAPTDKARWRRRRRRRRQSRARSRQSPNWPATPELSSWTWKVATCQASRAARPDRSVAIATIRSIVCRGLSQMVAKGEAAPASSVGVMIGLPIGRKASGHQGAATRFIPGFCDVKNKVGPVAGKFAREQTFAPDLRRSWSSRPASASWCRPPRKLRCRQR